MNGLAAWLVQVYAWMLRLYPPHYQSEFADERQEVFSLALRETAEKGNWALAGLMFRELRDFPASAARAYMCEWEGVMKTLETNLGDDRLSWIGLLLGVWPIIFLGPVLAVAPYLPRQTAEFFDYDPPVWLAAVMLFSIIGVVVAWRKGFPRWVYPYLVILFFAILNLLGNMLSKVLGIGNPSLPVLLGAYVGFGAVAAFGLSRIPSTRKILRDVRADWTRLTFGMMAYLAWVMGFYGGDHLPSFGPGVWLPSLIVVAGVAVYLFCRSRLQRSLALLMTMFLSFLTKFIFPNDDVLPVLPVLLLAMFIFLPALVELFPHRSLTRITGK